MPSCTDVDIREKLAQVLGFLGLPTILVVLIAVLFVAKANAQLYTSNIVGTVTDQSGAVMPGAQVELLNVGTGVKQVTQTNAAGDYVFQYLEPGTYTLTVMARGFKNFVQENIALQTMAKVSVNVTLQPGPVTQSVTITAAPPLLQTQSGEQSTTLENTQVTELPIQARSIMGGGAVSQGLTVIDSLKLLSPGVISDTSNTWTISEGGVIRRDQDYIDGAMVTLTVYEGNAVDPAPDAVQEVKVMTNAFSAVYGDTGGSVALETTKSGTNQFHGDAYDYLQNTKLNAGNAVTHLVTPIVFNQPGFTVGGPVKKDKLFFFFNAQWTRDQTGAPYTGLTAPDASWTQGNFSNVLGTTAVGTDILGRSLYKGELFNYYTQRTLTAGQVDPVTGLTANSAGTVRDPFSASPASTTNPNPTPTNIIPFGATTVCAPNSTCTSAPALNLQKLYPAPTTSAVYANFNSSPAAYVHFHQWNLKMDFYARPQDKIMGRWSSGAGQSYIGIGTVSPFPGLGGGGYYAPALETSQQPVLDWVHTFSANVINDVHVSYLHDWEQRLPVGYGQVGLSTYGITIPSLPQASLLYGVPAMTFSGSSGVQALGSNGGALLLQGDADIYINELFSLVHGRHSLQFGGEIQRMQQNNLQPNPQGTNWTFTNDFTDQYSGSGVGSTGFDFASFLLGLPNNFAFSYFPNVADVRASIFAAFAQDDFRVRSNLTVNLGLRWDAPHNWYGVNGTVGAIYLFNGTTAPLQTLGQNGFRNTEWNNNYDYFTPRIGVAWSPHFLPKTVFRGGYGIFTIGVQEGGAQGGFPLSPLWKIQSNSRYADSLTSALTPEATFTNIPYSPSQNPLSGSPGLYPNHNPSSTAQQWNVGIQHEFPGQIMLNVAYAGAHDVHLPTGGFSYNEIPPSLLATCKNQDIAGCVPYPSFPIGAGSQAIWLASNIYHALQISATKRFSNGLTFLLGYTWEKNIDDGYYGYREPVADRMLDRGFDQYSVPQRFTMSYDYFLPAGPGRRWLNHGPLVPFLGGWQFGGIVTLQDGFPLTASTSFNCLCSNASTHPNQLGPAVPSGFNQNHNTWFDANNFANGQLYTIGTEADSTFFGPPLSNINFSLSKHFYFPKLSEQKNLEFRVDFFNAFNTPWWGNPQTNIVTDQAAKAPPQITGVQAGSTPRSIQMALKFFF